MSTELNTEILIEGAGPTGLMAANQLMRFGVNFIIVDSKSCPTKELRVIDDSIKHPFSFNINIVEQSLSEKWLNLGVKSELFILVRPDNYIADQLDEKQIKQYLQTHFF